MFKALLLATSLMLGCSSKSKPAARPESVHSDPIEVRTSPPPSSDGADPGMGTGSGAGSGSPSPTGPIQPGSNTGPYNPAPPPGPGTTSSGPTSTP
ncbi:MAG: hypothetical protein H0T46_05470 [Deltaproteobacteria bacterium]|nr:hypothetical protein [Deltaproteobacteria bacterium]